MEVKGAMVKAVDSVKVSAGAAALSLPVSIIAVQRDRGFSVLETIPPVLITMGSSYNLGRLISLRRVERMCNEGIAGSAESFAETAKKLRRLEVKSDTISLVGLAFAFVAPRFFKGGIALADSTLGFAVATAGNMMRSYIFTLTEFCRRNAEIARSMKEFTEETMEKLIKESEEKGRTAPWN